MRPRGIPRGKPPTRRRTRSRAPPFNEAAGNTPRKTAGGESRANFREPAFNEAAGNTPRKTAKYEGQIGRIVSALQ